VGLHPNQKRVAIVGTGIAGLSAAWLLNDKHDVTVFERNETCGGHANTVDVEVAGRAISVDTGFIVYNDRNYPNLVALFDHLGVETHASDMSFSVSLGGGRFEYGSTGLNALFGQRRNLVSPRFWRMLRDLRRFYEQAPRHLQSPRSGEIDLGTFLVEQGYSDRFIEEHLLPMGAAIWSTTADDMRDYPLLAFLRFFESHGLLALDERPQWRSVCGGSRRYVERISAPLRDKINLGVGVRKICRRADHVAIEDTRGLTSIFDDVVLATHADEARALLADPDDLERSILAPFRCTANRAVLHSDPRLMPRRPRVWSSWNYIGEDGRRTEDKLSVTYWMNRLQQIESSTPLFVTLNPNREPRRDLVHGEFQYEHPAYDTDVLYAQRRLWSLQGHRNTWFCGSYFGYGFHEDALQAGLAVAEQLGGVRRPWQVDDESSRILVAPSERRRAA
jgi:predicted NAD/FAD-binding protein